MKSTKFRPVPNTKDTFEIWSHRRFRGYVYRVSQWVEQNYVHSKYEANCNVTHIYGWVTKAFDGTIVGDIFENRRKAAVRLLTDHRFSAKVK